jgi:hypothetical protein
VFFALLALSVHGLVYTVTVPSGTKACYIAGEMNNWTQQEMSKVDATHYTINLASATSLHKYKYCSGPAWIYEELDAAGLTISNRSYTTADIVIKWAVVYTPTAGVTYNVTVPAGTIACYIAGNGARMNAVFENVKPYIGAVTLAGTDSVADFSKPKLMDASTIKPIGQGNFNMKNFIEPLRKSKYKGNVGFINFKIEEDPEIYLINSMLEWEKQYTIYK